jgi:class 3 adenylate cyclase
VPAAEERKLVSVLFADLVGSTQLAGGEDPERVRARLARFYDAMSEEIGRTGGTVEKFAGDAVMAVFGAPAALEDHAERALNAGLAMQRRLLQLFGGEVEMRVGVNTGEVVVGGTREGSSFVAGDVVNVADRLQKAALPGEVLAGERTVAAAAGAFELAAPRRVEARGKPDGVVGIPVLNAVGSIRPRGVSGLRRVFVGRDSELELLRATYRRACANAEPHLVTIVGEPGVGKSRLVHELWDVLVAEERAPVVRTGRCLAYGDGITYWPLGEIVREHFGLRDGATVEDVNRALQGREILGLALGLDVAPELHPLDARERLHASAVAFVEELASASPTVVLVEDIHWAEPDLLDLLERVVTDARAPVVLLTTARPELFDQRSTWGSGRRNTTVLWLDPLAVLSAAQMLDEMLPAVLPDDLRERLVQRAGGNPFFLEELVGELVDSGALVRDVEGWSLGERDADFSMPDTVHAVLAARIDRLPPVEKSALQAGAVVGRVFWRAPVVHLLGGGDPVFDLLEERDLIVASRISTMTSDPEYTIKHALTREVAYGSIPKAQRGRLHAALAEWLEASELGTDERASFLAYHYSKAVDPEDADLVWGDDLEELARIRGRAVSWLRRAGELARGRYELDEAVQLLTRAVELTSDDHERASLLRVLGEVHALRYDATGLRDSLTSALDGPLNDAERADTYAFLAFQASIRSAMFPIRLERHQIDVWAENALALAADGTEARARAMLALVNIEPSLATDEALDEASALAESLDSLELRSFALGARSQTAFEKRRYTEAVTWSDQRLELIDRIDDPDHRCEAYEGGAPVAAALGDFSRARQLTALHDDLARRLSAHHRVHTVSLELELADAIGDWAGLVSETARVWNLVSANLATPCVRNPRDLLLCAAAHCVLGDESRAAELEQDAMRVAGEGFASYLGGPMLRIALARGDRSGAEVLVDVPIERTNVWGVGALAARLDVLAALGRSDLVENEAPTLLEDASILRPFALRALGATRGDDDLLAKADERFASLGLDWHRSQTERLLAGI